MREFLQALGIVALLFACAVGLIHVEIANDCETYSTITGRETKMGNMMCYIKHNDQWFSRDEFKAPITANGELIHE